MPAVPNAVAGVHVAPHSADVTTAVSRVVDGVVRYAMRITPSALRIIEGLPDPGFTAKVSADHVAPPSAEVEL